MAVNVDLDHLVEGASQTRPLESYPSTLGYVLFGRKSLCEALAQGWGYLPPRGQSTEVTDLEFCTDVFILTKY